MTNSAMVAGLLVCFELSPLTYVASDNNDLK
jgi:hypothetical protein